jgi:hypothetical protein
MRSIVPIKDTWIYRFSRQTLGYDPDIKFGLTQPSSKGQLIFTVMRLAYNQFIWEHSIHKFKTIIPAHEKDH